MSGYYLKTSNLCYNLFESGDNMLEFIDYLCLLTKSIIYTMFLFITIYIMMFFINVDINLANMVCNTMNIPKDLTLTVVSPGFANEFVLILLFFETIVVSYLGIMLSKNKFLNDLYYKIRYL